MSVGTKTLRGNYTVWVARPEAFADWSQPISAAKFATSLAAGLIADISIAVEDAVQIGLTGSTLDSSMSIVDIAKIESPLSLLYDGVLSLFRNKPGSTDTPVYDVALSWFDGVDVPVYLIKRVDKAQGTPVAVGDILSSFGYTTDFGKDGIKSDGMLMYDVLTKPTGAAYPDLTVVA